MRIPFGICYHCNPRFGVKQKDNFYRPHRKYLAQPRGHRRAATETGYRLTNKELQISSPPPTGRHSKIRQRDSARFKESFFAAPPKSIRLRYKEGPPTRPGHLTSPCTRGSERSVCPLARGKARGYNGLGDRVPRRTLKTGCIPCSDAARQFLLRSW